MTSQAKDKIIVALDVPDARAADKLLNALGDSVTWIKIGLQLFTAEGPSLVRDIRNRGYKVFLDLKFHDIPNTAFGAVRSAVDLGVDMTTIHLFGGQPMIGTTVEAAKGSPLLVLGVSVLTSFNQEQLTGIGVSNEVGDQVLQLVQLGYDVGLRGVVCSPHEIARLRKQFGDDLTIVTPGVRPAGSDKGDQQRVMTPSEAIKEGASYLVIGRPITGAADPAAAARKITEEIAAAL